LGTNATVKEFTFLLIHVLHVSHPAAFEGSTHYARETVDGVFRKYTQIDISHIEQLNHKFRNLNVESLLDIAVAGRPKGYRVPNCNIYKYEYSEGLAVVFELETRLTKRHVPPHCDFDLIEVERTDYLPVTGRAQRQVADMRVSYVNARDAGGGRYRVKTGRGLIQIVLILIIIFLLLLLFIICVLGMIFVIHWRVVDLMQLLSRPME
jgi:hypothetical protein